MVAPADASHGGMSVWWTGRQLEAIYASMGSVRDPEHDFSPAPEVLVRAYRLDLGTIRQR